MICLKKVTSVWVRLRIWRQRLNHSFRTAPVTQVVRMSRVEGEQDLVAVAVVVELNDLALVPLQLPLPFCKARL